MTLEARAEARLPAYKGSLLRGAFGHALRRAVCAMGPDQPCAECSLRTACVYTRLFETLIEGEPPPFLKGLPTGPRPFVFEPHGETRDFGVSDPLVFDLVLLGQAVELQSFAVLAIERMAKTGLGARRYPFELARVEWQDGDGSWRLGHERGVREWRGGVPGVEPSGESWKGGRLRLDFMTPTRIQIRGRLVEWVSFRALAFQMLRRVLELAHFHVPGEEVDWHFRPLLERAEGVEVVEEDFRWVDWWRYSNRQKRKMVLGGFVGHLVLEGDLGPFVDLLRAAEVVHVGKGATFGLGKVRVSRVPFPRS